MHHWDALDWSIMAVLTISTIVLLIALVRDIRPKPVNHDPECTCMLSMDGFGWWIDSEGCDIHG